MNQFFTRQRLSLLLCLLGVILMGVDLLLTRDFFSHIGELMAASILCFVLGLALDHGSDKQRTPPAETDQQL